MNTKRRWWPIIVCLVTSTIPTFLSHGAAAENSLASRPQRPRPSENRQEVSVGDFAPGWKLKTAADETIGLTDLQGKVVVLDFWANWCGPCRKLEPLFDQLVREYSDKPITFLTLSIWADRDFNPRTYLKEHKMASTFVNGDDKVASDYGIWGVPTYYVIDQTGRVSYVHVLLHVDADALGKRLRQAIEKTLQKESYQTAWPPIPPADEVSEQRLAVISRGSSR